MWSPARSRASSSPRAPRKWSSRVCIGFAAAGTRVVPDDALIAAAYGRCMTIAVDDPGAIERSAEKTCKWIEDAAFALGTDDRHEAYTTLNAVLHAVRDGLTVEAAADLAAELPDRLRWAFYEHWIPSRVPVTYHDRDEFLRRVASEAELRGSTEVWWAVASVMTVLTRHVSAPELDRVLGALPGQVRCLFELTVRDTGRASPT
jgi:uncharacterized protein (DUF2267 family)